MAELDKDESPQALKLADKLGVTIHEILRYGFGGFLALGVAAISNPDAIKNVANAIGPVLLGLSTFAAGAAIYVLVRSTTLLVTVWTAECIYWWLLDRNFVALKTRCAYLREKYGFGFLEAEDAWRAINRNHPWNENIQTRFYRQHSELHLIHTTAVLLLVGGIFRGSVWFGILSLFCAVIAGFADLMLSRQEFTELSRYTEDAEKILRSAGFTINSAEPGNTTSHTADSGVLT